MGNGFPESYLNMAVPKADFIAVDSGGTDLGPYDLGSGENTAHGRESVIRDLRLLILASAEYDIPLLVGTAGHAGGDLGLQRVRGFVEDIIKTNKLHLRIAFIHAEQKKEFLLRKLAQNMIETINPWGFSKEYPINEESIEGCDHIVGVMGVEPYIKAINDGAQVVIAGRSSDPAIVAAILIKEGFPPGPVWHAAQIVCDQGEYLARIRRDHFVLEPIPPEAKINREKIIRFALHETGSPYYIPEPGGVIDMSEARYEMVSERTLKVTGSKFNKTKYTIKLEGARKEGFRSIFFGGVRDRRIISQVGPWIEGFKKSFDSQLADQYGYRPKYSMNFFVYGRDGVMGPLESVEEITSHEIFILAEVIAPTEDTSIDLATNARQMMMHFDPPLGPYSRNTLAIPFSPMQIKHGWVYRWTFNHRIVIDAMSELDEMFPIDYLDT